MESMFKKMSKTHMIIQLCEEPKRFGELQRALRISDAGLAKHLDSLQNIGWVVKKRDGSYSLTPSGRRVLPAAQRAAAVLKEFRRAATAVDGVSVDYHGLKGRDSEEFLEQLSVVIRHYLRKRPSESFGLLINYRPRDKAVSA